MLLPFTDCTDLRLQKQPRLHGLDNTIPPVSPSILNKNNLSLTIEEALVNGRSIPNGSGIDAKFEQSPPTGAMEGPAGPLQIDDLVAATSAPSSPYTAQRTTIRSLTLPTNPNLDIPPSPPQSPAPGADKKFAHFLELKKQGVHFNEKLASSSALKNPSLLPKLMKSAGVEEHTQYNTTLSKSLWDPEDFPSWAYKEALLTSQQMASKKKAEEKAKAPRSSIDFVSAGGSGQSSRVGTPGLGTSARHMKGSAAERVMAGLDREKKPSPHRETLAHLKEKSKQNFSDPF